MKSRLILIYWVLTMAVFLTTACTPTDFTQGAKDTVKNEGK